ncbi:hypothetical protein BDW62DRAFT_212286 [Aspergillus aurantiobrunneus]
MDQFAGIWVMNKSLCTGVDGILKLQGISWPLRKTINLASLRLNITVYLDDTSGAIVVDDQQTLTGGLKGARERRVLDWTRQNHKDDIFGSCQHQSRAAAAEEGQGFPTIEMQTKVSDDKAEKFLRGEIGEDGKASGWCKPRSSDAASGDDVWLHTFVRNSGTGWTAEQVWGFEEINGKIYHTRRVVAADSKGQYAMGRLVYLKE